MQQIYQNGDSEVIFTIDTDAMKLTAIDAIAAEGVLTIRTFSDPTTMVGEYVIEPGTWRKDLPPEEQVDAYISGKGDVRVRHNIAWPSAANGLSKLDE